MSNRFPAASQIKNHSRLLPRLAAIAFLLICPLLVRAQDAKPGLGQSVVNSAFGGFILGYDIEANGKEGILAEAGGQNTVAIETFDQTTGKILKVAAQQKNTKNDFVTFGIFGRNVGLIEEELSSGRFVTKRLYGTLNPVDGNKITGHWTPPFTKDDIVMSMPVSQGSLTTPVLYFNTGGFSSFVISTNVAANTFGTPIMITDSIFDENNSPRMAYDTKTNQAVLASSNGCFGCPTRIGLVDLNTGNLSTFPGLGLGSVNGIAVDSESGIACTTTEDDFSLEIYDLNSQSGFIVPLQGATSQANSGGDVEFDPIHKLFLIGQEFSSVAPGGSSILVYDEQGNFLEAVNGLSLPASPAYMALHPSNRTGYVIVTPALSSLQSFTY
jgi:hypothetical protein